MQKPYLTIYIIHQLSITCYLFFRKKTKNKTEEMLTAESLCGRTFLAQRGLHSGVHREEDPEEDEGRAWARGIWKKLPSCPVSPRTRPSPQ